MQQRGGLADKLEKATQWVRTEFAALEDFTTGLGCEHHVEGRDGHDPGLAFYLAGRRIGRAHPKLRYIALGFPDAMRADVDALTGALRPQKGDAWFNFTSDAADRETVERLLNLSVDVLSRAGATPGASPVRALTALDDEQDLRLVLGVLRAFRDHEEATGTRSSVKPIREALFARWEWPRLPPGRRYSPQLPHSPEAREKRRLHGKPTGLVYEHVAPISGVIRELLLDLPADEKALRQALEKTEDRVVVTKEQDAKLTAAGYRNTAPDPEDPWSRYRSALGLERSDFVPYRSDGEPV